MSTPSRTDVGPACLACSQGAGTEIPLTELVEVEASSPSLIVLLPVIIPAAFLRIRARTPAPLERHRNKSGLNGGSFRHSHDTSRVGATVPARCFVIRLYDARGSARVGRGRGIRVNEFGNLLTFHLPCG